MNRIMKSSNKGNKSTNFSLKCLKSLQGCIRDLKKSMRQMQFESQRIQKHVIQQILNNTNNLLTALTSCNLYRINFQEEMYYLNQLQKIERGINEISNFVTKMIDRRYFTSIGNNKLETTFDGFVGPLLHIFNSFNLNWLVFQCDSLKLFLLDEFNYDLICKKLGIQNQDEIQLNLQSNGDQSYNNENQNINNNDNILQNNQQNILNKQDINNQKEYVQNDQSNISINIIQNNSIQSKIQRLKNTLIENQISKKQFLTDLINVYKSILPENTCICDLAVFIDFMSNSNPFNYSQVFLEFYMNLFDFQTSEKISFILKKTPNFQTLNKYTRLIFYNNDLMYLSMNEINTYLNSSSSQKYQDLHIKLIRSGFNPFQIPVTTSPVAMKGKKDAIINKFPQFNFQCHLASQQQLAQHSQPKNCKLSSSNFKVNQEIVVCPHYSNFFEKAPNIHDFNAYYNNEEISLINCHYIQQLFDKENDIEGRIREEFQTKRSSTIEFRRSEILSRNVIKEIQLAQLSKRSSLMPNKGQPNYLKIQSQTNIALEEQTDQLNLFKKKEILFGRKAENSIIRPDFCFENHEFSISRQQFKLTYEDQSNEYFIQCMSHSSLTQFVIDEQGFELSTGSVFIIQDLIAFQVIQLKQFPEQACHSQRQSLTNITSKGLNRANSPNIGDTATIDIKDYQSKKKQYKKRFRSGRLSYKNLQLFEEYDNSTSNDIRSSEFDDKLEDLESSIEENINHHSEKDDSNRKKKISDCSNSQCESNENSSISQQSSINSLPSYNNLLSNTAMHYERRSSLLAQKNQIMNQGRQQQAKNNLKQSPQSNNPDSSLESLYVNKNTSIEQSPIQKTPLQGDNRPGLKPRIVEKIFSFRQNVQEQIQILKSDTEEQNNLQEQEQTPKSQNQQIQIIEAVQINQLISNENGDEVTLDFKQSLNITQNDKQQQQSSLLQSIQMNSMSLSTQKINQSSIANQSAYSLTGQSLYEFEDDPNKDDAILHIRVLWSSFDTEKEDYKFQYNNQNEKDKICINFGSNIENQVRMQDDNNSIKPFSHCSIMYQDNAWTIISQNNNSNEYYSGLALKNVEEIENGLISKKILIENGQNILVQGYIFSCEI